MFTTLATLISHWRAIWFSENNILWLVGILRPQCSRWQHLLSNIFWRLHILVHEISTWKLSDSLAITNPLEKWIGIASYAMHQMPSEAAQHSSWMPLQHFFAHIHTQMIPISGIHYNCCHHSTHSRPTHVAAMMLITNRLKLKRWLCW